MIVSRNWSWVCLNIALTLCLTLKVLSEEANQAALVGIVYCDICFNQEFSKSSHFISGASVAVECGGGGIGVRGMESRFREEVKTNWKGEFRVKLPFEVSGKIRECSVKLISSNEPDCPVAATAKSPSITLKMRTPGKRVFSAGFFTFRPRKQPRQCQTGTRNKNSNDGFSAPTPFPSPIGKQTTTEFDDLAEPNTFGLPLPYQFQPPSPVPLFPFQPPPDSMFIPYSHPPPDSMFIPDFQPPPDSMFNPIPLQPPPESVFDQFEPSPSMLIPQLITPPPPEFFPSRPFQPIQPLPNLIQSPPPPPTPLPASTPPPPFLPPFPPFPFQPSQGMPGTPPGISSSHLKKTLSP